MDSQDEDTVLSGEKWEDALLAETNPDEPPEWQDRALCAQTDPEAFFPEKGGSTREAKRICTGCEVRTECLEYALAHDERFGIWGGLSERERRKLKRRVG
jgi:WhiB family redox-sensing transcriptional regulator